MPCERFITQGIEIGTISIGLESAQTLFLCLGLDLTFSRHLRPSFLFLAFGKRRDRRTADPAHRRHRKDSSIRGVVARPLLAAVACTALSISGYPRWHDDAISRPLPHHCLGLRNQ